MIYFKFVVQKINMKKNILMAFIGISTFFTYGQKLKYPETNKNLTVDTYHDTKVKDYYQWLENTDSLAVKDWVKKQNKVSLKYLKKLAIRNNSRRNMEKFFWSKMDYEVKYKSKKNKNYQYSIMYPGRNSTANIYYKKGNKGSFEELINSETISTKDQINFTAITPSMGDRFLAYQYNRNGKDWEEIKIVGIKKRIYFKEVLKEVLNPQINWYGQGFFYVKNKYNPKKISRKYPEIMYHKLNTPQSEDKLILKTDSGEESFQIYGTSDQSLYIIKKQNDFKNRYSYYYLKPKSETKTFKTLFDNIKYDMRIVRFKSDTVFVKTKIKNKNYIIKFPIKEPKKWAMLTPSYRDAVFTGFTFIKDRIISSYQTKKASIISVSNFEGKVLGEVMTPEGMSVSSLYYNKELKKVFFRLSSYTVPPVTCELDYENFTFKYLGQKEVGFDASKYKFIRKNAISHDGKKIPMFIVYKDSLKKDGTTPFLLKTYGGYGTIAKPSFNPGLVYFIERGGAFAYVHVRGGGEFGYKWWHDGKNLKKKNGILDFTKAAEFLINEGYSSPKKIGITGGSHGGLITAGAMIEKPNYFGAAVFDVGVFDILKMENTEAGEYFVNISEFGTVKKKDEFLNMLSYSPFHNVNPEVNYPSTLIVTGTDDSRVPPYQSYKFAGKLQNGKNQKNPILLWVQNKAGHGGANRYSEVITEYIYRYNFLFDELTKKK